MQIFVALQYSRKMDIQIQHAEYAAISCGQYLAAIIPIFCTKIHDRPYLRNTINVAACRLGITGINMVNTLDGKWVKTIVLIIPILAAIHLQRVVKSNQ